MKWLYKIELNNVIKTVCADFDLSKEEEDCPVEVKRLLTDELNKAPPLQIFSSSISQAKSIAEVNRILDQVYDEADRYKVWCGL